MVFSLLTRLGMSISRDTESGQVWTEDQTVMAEMLM